MNPRSATLDLRVRLLAEPCLWCWEIVDHDRGALVLSSWASEWAAYESAGEALTAGQGRLAELGCAGAGSAGVEDAWKGVSAA